MLQEIKLWFGDERGYNATNSIDWIQWYKLWFGDERGYNATSLPTLSATNSCGLVMKEDITQHQSSHYNHQNVVVW